MSPRKRRPEPPEECSQCGESIPRDALACPGCGADERTGWDANPWLPGEEVLPDDDEWDEDRRPPIFDHETWTPKRWVAVALIVLAAFAFIALQRSSVWFFHQR